MKRPIIIVAAIILGIMATNALIPAQDTVTDQLVEDSIETSQAAATEVLGDIPL